MIRVMRDLDVDRLRVSPDSKNVTHQDWMIAALLALNTSLDTKFQISPESIPSMKSLEEKDKEEDAKTELALATGDSTGPVGASLPNRQDDDNLVELGKKEEPEFKNQTSETKCEDELVLAIKTLQKPFIVDPLAKHDFDSFIVETFQR